MNGDMMLSTALTGFILARKADGYSTGGLGQYEWALERLVHVIGDKPIAAVTIDDLRRYLSWMQNEYTSKGGRTDPLSSTSIFHAWKAVRAFYSWLHSEYNIERIDARLQRPKFLYPEIVPFGEEEIRAIFKACERSRMADTAERRSYSMRRPTAKRDLAIVSVLLDTGIRVGELTRLLVSDVDLQAGEVRVVPYRSGLKSRPRTIPIGAITRKTVWRYLSLRENLREDAYLFVSTSGRQLTPNAVLQLLREIGERAGVPRCHPHRFRHTFAIEYLRNGGDVFTLKRILGHTTLKTVEHYLSIVKTDVAAAHRRASPVDNLKL